jgi:hypothetical protein
VSYLGTGNINTDVCPGQHFSLPAVMPAQQPILYCVNWCAAVCCESRAVSFFVIDTTTPRNRLSFARFNQTRSRVTPKTCLLATSSSSPTPGALAKGSASKRKGYLLLRPRRLCSPDEIFHLTWKAVKSLSVAFTDAPFSR